MGHNTVSDANKGDYKSLCYPNKTEEDQDTLQEITNKDVHEHGGV
jgi:hypothetical protein